MWISRELFLLSKGGDVNVVQLKILMVELQAGIDS